MDWIKRNLLFVLFGVAAVVLLGAAGYYDVVGWRHNASQLAKLNADYNTLRDLNNKKPSPGNAQVDNIKAARQQTAALRRWIQRARRYFVPVPSIPHVPTNGVVRTEDFARGLSRTINELTREAANASVSLPQDYAFSFTVERNQVAFAPGSLAPLARQLGEVKALSQILFAAKINALDNLRRVPISAADTNGAQTDYLTDQPVTNQLTRMTAVMMPYEVTFRGFSQNVADVLTGLANSPYCFIVKGLNVAPAGMTGSGTGIGPGTGATPGTGGEPDQGGPTPYPTPYRAAYPTPYPTRAGPARRGWQTVLNEQMLRITMEVEVVRLLPGG